MVFVTTDMPEKVVKLDDEHRSGFACHEIGCKAIFSFIQQENGNVFISNWAILTNCENIQKFSWCLND